MNHGQLELRALLHGEVSGLVEHADNDFAVAQEALVGVALGVVLWMIMLGLSTTLLQGPSGHG